jgi:hypothetical protein
MKRRWRLFTLLPLGVCLALYWPGLFAWFQMDDYYWLSMLSVARGERGVLGVLVTPTVHGTWRPLSEQSLFLLFSWLFGLQAWPYRLLAMGTQLLNLLLLGRLARRLWGSELAAGLVPLLWIVNATLAMPMVWTCSYNQILGTTVFAGGMTLVDVWIEREELRHLLAAALVFAAGLLVLETVIVLPWLAAAWVLLRAPRVRWRSLLLRLLPGALASLGYLGLHVGLAPPLPDGVYALHFDAGMLATALRYWRWSVAGPHFTLWFPGWLEVALVVLFSALGLGVLVRRARRGDRRPLAGVAWYLAALAPLLPLTAHQTDYLLVVPTAGLALALGGPLAAGLIAVGARRLTAGLALLVYLAAMVPQSAWVTRGLAARSLPAARILPALVDARARHPDRPIVLADVGDELYEFALGCKALYFLQIERVYLTPEAAAAIHPGSAGVLPSELLVPPHEQARALVYSLAGDRLTLVPP